MKESLSGDDISVCSAAFKALGDETRLRIVEMLSAGELCACKILEEFNITQPALSYHMKVLTSAGLVKARRDGAWVRYMLNDDTCGFLEKILSNLVMRECHKNDSSDAISCAGKR